MARQEGRSREATTPSSAAPDESGRPTATPRFEDSDADGTAVAVPWPFRLPHAVDAFYAPEFTWFYVSMLGHMASLNMQLVIRGLLAYELTGSYAALGLVGLAGAVPMLLLSVFGGVVADRIPKRRVMQLGQAASLVNAAVMAALVFAGLMNLTWLLVTATAQGVVMALMMPARQAMLPEIVGLDRMMNAVSLNMAGMNSMRLFAPALGGFIVGFFGFGWAFSVMALLYAFAVFAMSRVPWRPASAPNDEDLTTVEIGKSAVSDIGAGLIYIWRDHKMLIILSFTFITSIFGMPIQFLLPGYVSDIFADDAREAANLAGTLLSVSAIGAIAGAMFLATIPDRNRGKLFLVGAGILGVGVFLFAQTANVWVAGAFMMIVGLGSTARMAISQGLLHTYVQNEYRGRVMSLFMTQMSLMQLSVFVVGVVAEVVGIRMAIAGLGALLIGTTVLASFALPTLRRLD